jgi:hypothetical protein
MGRTMKVKVALMVGLMTASFGAGVWADGAIEKVEAYLRKDLTIKVNGEIMNLSDKPPIIYNDNSYLPIRALGEALDADIVWEDSTQTIFVNKGKYDIQPGPDEEDAEYDTIELGSMYGLEFQYLGRSYPVFINGYIGVEYYRLKDIQRMGVNVGPLKKVKERITGDLYVSAAEVEKAWKEKPVIGYTYSPLVVGETDKKKIEAMITYNPTQLYPDMDFSYYVPMTIFVIDAAEQENEYVALGYRENGYYKIKYKLSSRNEIKLENNLYVIEKVWHVDQYITEFLAKQDDGYNGYNYSN